MPSLLKPIFCSNNINDIQKAFAFHITSVPKIVFMHSKMNERADNFDFSNWISCFLDLFQCAFFIVQNKEEEE